MSPVSNPVSDPNWRPVSMPMPAPQEVSTESNSLWRQGSRTFLRDQRAAAIGDIVTVLVSVQDEAQLQNRTQASRNGETSASVNSLLGLEASARRVLPRAVNPANLANTQSTNTLDGNGSVRRTEQINLRLAATIAQILPNGNMVVVGKQEVRVNNELRELSVQGVLRPQDIGSDNTVRHDRLAEARITYGGRGIVSDVQRPRYGQELLDIILPF